MALGFVRLSQQHLNRTTTPDYNAAYTFCFWVYFVDHPLQMNLMGIMLDNSNMDAMFYQFPEDRISLFATPGTGSTVTTGSFAPVSGTWYFMAMVRRSTSSLQLYIGTGPSDLALTASNTLVLSARSAATRIVLGATNVPIDFWINGRLTGAKLWDGYDMSLSELQLEAASITPVRTTNLWAFWPLRGSPQDLSGNGRHLTIVNGPLTQEADPSVPQNWPPERATAGLTASF